MTGNIAIFTNSLILTEERYMSVETYTLMLLSLR